MNHFAPHPHFFRLPQIDEAVFLLKGDRTDGAECSYAAPAPFKFRCVCPDELAAKFYLDWDKEKIAASYMQEAYYWYAKWGAKAKTDDLEKRYSQLLKPILEQQRITFNPSETIAFPATSSSTRTSTSKSTSISDILDFTSVLKAAQTISSSIELDELITNLTKIIIENSGAKKSVLILPQEDNWQVRAITFTNHQNNL